MCTMVVTQLPTAPLLLLLLAVKLGARGTVHSLLRGPSGVSGVLGLRVSGGKVQVLGWSSRTFHVAPFSLEALLRLAGLFLPLGLPSKSVRKSGGSASLRGPVHAWMACGWWTCVVLLDLRRLLMARVPSGPVASSAFLLGSLSVTTEMERPMGLVMERSLLGRRDRGGGRPVRLRSMPSRLPLEGPEGPLMAREPFMVDKGDLREPGLGAGPAEPDGGGRAGSAQLGRVGPRLPAADLVPPAPALAPRPG